MGKELASNYEQQLRQLHTGQLKPVYFFFGEENYYLDKLADALQAEALAGAEPSFNLDIFYGAEVTAATITAAARSYPVMALRRLVVVKDAQRLRKEEQERLAAYLAQPNPSAVMLLLHRDKRRPDQRTTYGKAVSKHAEVFEAKPLYDNQVARWIEEEVQTRKARIAPEAAQVMASWLGTNLQVISSELDKIFLHLAGKPNPFIDRNLVYELINLDKDFNIFELQNQLGARNVQASHLILHQMLKNTKDHAPISLLYQLTQFYRRLALLRYKRILNEQGIAQELGLHPFVAKNYVVALQHYSYAELTRNLHYLLQADLALKGVTPTRMPEEHTLKWLLYRLLNSAPTPVLG